MRASSRPTVLPMADWPARQPVVPGTSVLLGIDERVPGADMYGGIIAIEPGRSIPVHWHDVGEMQFVVSGTGVFVDGKGNEIPVEPHHLVFAPSGTTGSHGFRNTSSMPLVLLFFYPSPGGAALASYR